MPSAAVGVLVSCLLASCGRLRFEDHAAAALRDGGAPDSGAEPDASHDAGDVAEAGGFDDGGDESGLPGDAEGGAPDAGPCPGGSADPACQTCVRYVDAEAPAQTADGLSWASAFPSIIAASASGLAQVGGSANHCQIWVRKGRYHTYLTNKVDGIPLSAQLELYGGFVGDETSTTQRTRGSENETIIDGANADGSGRSLRAVYASSGDSWMASRSRPAHLVSRATAEDSRSTAER